MKKVQTGKTVVIEGTCFIVNIERQILVERDYPGNEISFVTEMKDCGDHYEILYDRKKKNVRDAYSSDDVIAVHVPRLVELDPEGMAAKYNVPIDDLKGKTDFEVIVDQQLLRQRQSGVLPTIDVAGEQFVIDLRLQELRHAEHFSPVISMRSFDLSKDSEYYEAFYHPVIKQVVAIDPKLTEFPEGVVAIKLPNDFGLDPVAAARIYEIDEREMLRYYPIQKNLKAEFIALSETGIPALIQKNRQVLREEHETIKKQNKHKLRKGPRL